ncbi:MAG: RNA polymerase sigma-70 factor [Cyclobacteriaceae bacterium]
MKNRDSSLEKILLANLKNGDKDAFSTIFSAYYSDLVFFAFSFVKSASTAEDIVQDTFIKLWEDRYTVNITKSLNSYLLKAIQNRCIDWYRHRDIMINYSNSVVNNNRLLECDTENWLNRSELEGQIKKALQNISPELSEAFRMNRFEGLKYSEIAKKLNVSVRTIEVRIGKALQLLREHLNEYLTAIVFTGIFNSGLWPWWSEPSYTWPIG